MAPDQRMGVEFELGAFERGSVFLGYAANLLGVEVDDSVEPVAARGLARKGLLEIE